MWLFLIENVSKTNKSNMISIFFNTIDILYKIVLLYLIKKID